MTIDPAKVKQIAALARVAANAEQRRQAGQSPLAAVGIGALLAVGEESATVMRTIRAMPRHEQIELLAIMRLGRGDDLSFDMAMVQAKEQAGDLAEYMVSKTLFGEYLATGLGEVDAPLARFVRGRQGSGRFLSKRAYKRAEAIADWRGYGHPEAADRSAEVRAVGVHLLTSNVIAAIQAKASPITEEDITACWKEVGGVLAENSRPDKLRNKVLYVRVLQPTVRYELQLHRERLLRNLIEKYGPDLITGVRFKFG